eukprot:sb/3467807/
MKSLETLDTLYEQNVQSLKALQCQLEERRKNDGRSRAERKAATLDLVKWIMKSQEKEVDNIWTPAKEELEEKDQVVEIINSALVEMMSGNVLSGCGGGSWDMWGSCTSPPEESLTGSYWSKEEESLDTSVSRILSLLKQPSLKRLEALANRLAPITTMKSTSAALAASSIAFKKPLHLVKEFVPRSERNKTSAGAASRSINLIYPPGLMAANLTGVHLKPIPLIQSPPVQMLVGRPVQRPFPVYHVPAQNFNTHIPPLPKELVHETPPNLSTIKVLSQLFNTY